MRLLKILCDHSSLYAIISCVHALLVLLVTQLKLTNGIYSFALLSGQMHGSFFRNWSWQVTWVGVCRTQYVNSRLWMAEVQQSLWKSSELTAWSQLPRLSTAKTSIVTSWGAYRYGSPTEIPILFQFHISLISWPCQSSHLLPQMGTWRKLLCTKRDGDHVRLAYLWMWHFLLQMRCQMNCGCR